VIARPARDDEVATNVALYNEAFPRDAVSVDEARAFYASAVAVLPLLAEVDGSAVGSGLGVLQKTDPGVALTIIVVRESHRRQGVGSALFAELRRWAAEHGADRLETWVNAGDEASLAYARARGFEIAAREVGLELDLLTAPVDAPSPPHGIELVRLAARPELADGMYDVASEAMQDVPGSEEYVMFPREDFVERHLHAPHGLAEGTFVALDGEEVVGYAKLRPADARPGAALNGLTAVKRAWRGRGIAGALKRAQIAWAAEAGYERLVSAVEERNEPIRRLNERLGYRPVPGRLTLRSSI
jgi:mycothiol synthase